MHPSKMLQLVRIQSDENHVANLKKPEVTLNDLSDNDSVVFEQIVISFRRDVS